VLTNAPIAMRNGKQSTSFAQECNTIVKFRLMATSLEILKNFMLGRKEYWESTWAFVALYRMNVSEYSEKVVQRYLNTIGNEVLWCFLRFLSPKMMQVAEKKDRDWNEWLLLLGLSYTLAQQISHSILIWLDAKALLESIAEVMATEFGKLKKVSDYHFPVPFQPKLLRHRIGGIWFFYNFGWIHYLHLEMLLQSPCADYIVACLRLYQEW